MKLHHYALIAAALIASSTVLAADDDYSVYHNSIRAGSETVFYHTKADDLNGPFVPAGVNFKAKDLETLYIGYVRNLSSHFAVELALGYPPLSKVEGRGPAALGSVPYNGKVVSSARWLSPTVLFEYSFLNDSSKIRPYIGAGVNYTSFYDRRSTAEGNAASGGPTKVSLSPSVGPAATAGVAYHFTSRWLLNVSYSWSRVNTRVSLDTAGVERETHIRFGPQVLVISGGYSF